jgi:hypothetical protein
MSQGLVVGLLLSSSSLSNILSSSFLSPLPLSAGMGPSLEASLSDGVLPEMSSVAVAQVGAGASSVVVDARAEVLVGGPQRRAAAVAAPLLVVVRD